MPDDLATIRRTLAQVKATCGTLEGVLLEGVPSEEMAVDLRGRVEGAKDRLQIVRDWLDNIGR